MHRKPSGAKDTGDSDTDTDTDSDSEASDDEVGNDGGIIYRGRWRDGEGSSERKWGVLCDRYMYIYDYIYIFM